MNNNYCSAENCHDGSCIYHHPENRGMGTAGGNAGGASGGGKPPMQPEPESMPCKECHFEEGHSFECSQYEDKPFKPQPLEAWKERLSEFHGTNREKIAFFLGLFNTPDSPDLHEAIDYLESLLLEAKQEYKTIGLIYGEQLCVKTGDPEIARKAEKWFEYLDECYKKLLEMETKSDLERILK